MAYKTEEEVIILGEDTKILLKGSVGQELIVQSELTKNEASDELMKLDPFSFFSLGELQSKIASIQNDYRRIASLSAYLENFIVEGENTLDTVHQNQNKEE